MNAELQTVDPITFELDSKLNPEKLHEEFRKDGRLRIRNFLQAPSANQLYQNLAHDVSWRMFLIANESLMGTPPGEPVGTNVDEEREIFNTAYEGARSGFACAFDADRLFAEDVEAPEVAAEAAALVPVPPRSDVDLTPTLSSLEAFLESSAVIDLLRRVTGMTGVESLVVRTRAMRLRPGHFATFHAGTWSADRTGKRRAAFYLNLTPEWRPEWGGMLEFRTRDADTVDAYVPSFNTLDLLAFPQGHWISPVAPFAGGPVLMIAGRIYVP